MTEFVQSVTLWIGLTVLLAAAIHLGIVLAVPYLVGIRLRAMAERNTIVHAPRPTADFNPIRSSSPDLIYSACPYDLSDGPLRITAPVPGTYMSVSCFALNTDNFYVTNDQRVEGAVDFVLVGPNAPNYKAPGTIVVRSPTTTGGIIFRYFIGDGTHGEEIEGMRREIRIAKLNRDE